MSNLAGRVCADHNTPAIWQSPQASRTSRGLAGGWYCGVTHGPLVEDDDGDLRHPQEQR
jgi:hypothetical protein